MNRARLALALICIAGLSLLTGCSRRKEIWIYTSLPKDVIAEMVEPLQAAVQGADVKWYQSASDMVASRLTSEAEAGNMKADLVLTTDPLWYVEQKRKGRLLSYDSPAARDLPAEYRDADRAFAAMRLSVMVMGYNSTMIKPAEVPERWKDLIGAKGEGKVSMATPLDSPQTFVALSMLSKLFGWDYFASLRKGRMVAEGTQSSVLTRIESGERPIGILPLESALRASAHNRSIKVSYPQDGAVLVPGLIAILKDTGDPEIAQRVYDWFFSSEGQKAVIRGGFYSPLSKSATPEGARPWAELQPSLAPWTTNTLIEMLSTRDQVRARFSEVVLH
jgi:iron(III) transport system substrate-binding protein